MIGRNIKGIFTLHPGDIQSDGMQVNKSIKVISIISVTPIFLGLILGLFFMNKARNKWFLYLLLILYLIPYILILGDVRYRIPVDFIGYRFIDMHYYSLRSYKPDIIFFGHMNDSFKSLKVEVQVMMMIQVGYTDISVQDFLNLLAVFTDYITCIELVSFEIIYNILLIQIEFIVLKNCSVPVSFIKRPVKSKMHTYTEPGIFFSQINCFIKSLAIS